MSATRLVEWLNGDRNYKQGCLLYHDMGSAVHSRDYYAALKSSLAMNRSPEKLLRALKECYHHFSQAKEKTVHESDFVVSHPAANVTQKEKLLAELNKEVTRYYQNLGSRWKPKLHEAKTDDERYEIQKTMVRLEEELQKVLDDIKHVEEHGTLPAEQRHKRDACASQAPGSAKAALQFVNVQKYVSLYERNVARATKDLMTEQDPQKIKALNKMLDKWTVKLANYKKDLAELRKLIAQP